MISLEDTSKLLANHLKWVEDRRPQWQRHRSAYLDRFWKDVKGGRRGRPTTNLGGGGTIHAQAHIHKVEINMVKPWITSFLASLYYKGIHFTVEPDQIAADDEGKERDTRVAAAIKKVVDRFFATEAAEDVAERAFSMGLLYSGGGAFKISRDKPDPLIEGEKATDMVWIDSMPPWEAVWDRRARSRRAMRYIGHLTFMSAEDVRAEFGKGSEDDPRPLPDVVLEGFRAPAGETDLDASYFAIFEFNDLTATHKMKVEGKEVETRGEFRVYLVEGMTETAEPKLTLLHDGPEPYVWPSGKPAINIEPFIPDPVPDYPLDSVAGVTSVYELNKELNEASSVLADAYRRDAGRIIFYLKDKVDEKVMELVTSGVPLIFCGIDGETLLGLFEELKLPPISDTLLKYRQALLDALDSTQLLADFTRGKAGEYLSATEVANLVNYTETTIGRVRKRMDKALAKGAQLYLRVLAEAQAALFEDEKTVPPIVVELDDGPFELTMEDLERRWVLQLVDTASTPVAAAQQRADFLTVLPQMLELASIQGLEVPLAAAALDELVNVMGLSNSFSTSVLKANAPPPEPEPAPPPVPDVPPAQGDQVPLTDEQQTEALLQTPTAQTIIAAGEAQL